ncbi:MAG TPA: ABC transporter substrate-binding protein [Candidatus Binatia bacterium]|nr:ABC transporter substrate-binding protein [Candidatus Binatia bacterium]
MKVADLTLLRFSYWMVALGAVIFLLCDAAPVAAERVTIATPSRGLFEFPVVVAMRKGFFKDEGIDVDKVQMQPALGVKALMSGDVDYLLAWGSALRAAVTGVPIKAVVGFAGRPLHVLIARPEIKTPKDLKGKVIGVDSVAGTVDYLSRVAVRHFGMEPDRDITIIVTGESPTRLAALRAGSIHATPIDVAFSVKAEDEGFRRLVYLGDLIELPLSGMAVMDAKLQSQREQVKKVVRAGVRGSRFMKQNRAETIQMLSDYLGITPPQSARAYDASINSFTTDGMISDKGVQLDVQLTKERLKITKDISITQLVDWSLVREIKAERP